MQLPPPIHGAAVINAQVATSAALASKFEIEVLPLAFTDSVANIGRPSLAKVVRAGRAARDLGQALIARRPNAVYFTIAPHGTAFYRDCMFVAIMRAFGIPRIYHLRGKGIAKHLDTAWRRALYRWVFQGAWVIHLSRTLARDIEQLVPPARILEVANGIPDRGPTERVARLGTPRILFLSTMVEEKGPLHLVEALAELDRRGVAFEAIFAGEPMPACVAAFSAAVAHHGLDAKVHYVGPAYGAAKDAHELAAQLEVLLRDPVVRHRMGQHARDRFVTSSTLEAFEANLVAALSTATRGASATS